jgi:hypothetical protein
LRVFGARAMTAAMGRHPRARGRAVAVLALAAAWLVGCGDDDRPASFRYIETAIFQPNCTSVGCHTGQNAQSGVRLDTVTDAYSILVGHPCEGNEVPGEAPRNYVDPFRPERSRLMYLLEGIEVRRMMPPDRPLPAADVDLVERWILDGAPCN